MIKKKLIAHMHLFCFGNDLFAYDYIKNVLIRVDSSTYASLENILKEKDSAVQSASSERNLQIDLFEKMGIMFSSDKYMENKPVEAPLKTAFISFPTTHGCNLQCKYCFANHGENYDGPNKALTKTLINDILEFVYFDCFKDYSRIRLDFVSGGEPLLNFDLIKDTVEISEKLYKKTNKPLGVFLCTNGTVNNPDIWKFINKHNINLGISLDGPQKVHDEVRIYPDGQGSYLDTVDTVMHIVNSTDYSLHTKSIWALSVITGKTSSLLDILEHNQKLGLKNIQMKLARLDKANNLAISETEIDKILNLYKELTEHFVEAAMKHDYTDLSLILNENDYFGKLIYRIIYGGRIKRCFAGERKLSFDGSGNIYPCDSFVGNDEFILGNIYSGIDEQRRKKFVNGTIFSRKKCHSCWARYICAGDCYHNSYLVNKDIYEPDAIFCMINRSLIEYALYLYFVIKNNGDLDRLKKVVRIKRRFDA